MTQLINVKNENEWLLPRTKDPTHTGYWPKKMPQNSSNSRASVPWNRRHIISRKLKYFVLDYCKYLTNSQDYVIRTQRKKLNKTRASSRQHLMLSPFKSSSLIMFLQQMLLPLNTSEKSTFPRLVKAHHLNKIPVSP